MRQQKKDKIRLMHIIYSLDTGGLEKLILELVKRVDSDIFRSSVCCLTDKGTLSAELESLGVDTFYMHKEGGVGYSIPFKIARVLKKEKIDIVHTHDSSANLYGSLAGKLAGTRMIINTEHGGIYFETKRKRLFNKLLCLFNHKEICVSNSVKEDLLGMGLSGKRLIVIRNGIDFNRFDIPVEKNEIRKDFGFKDSDYLVTTVGRLSREKNQKLLLDAVKPTLERIPEAKFIIVGNGPLRKNLEEYANELQIADKVKFLGERNDIPQVLKMSDCFVLCSNYESFGITIIEAMASGIPVIATDVGGVKETVWNGKTGVLVSKEDSEDLSRAVIRIKNDSQLADRMVLQAKEMVKNNYRIETMIREHENLYLNYYRKMAISFPQQEIRVLTFALDNRPLLNIEGHAKRWHGGMGQYVTRLDVKVEVKEDRKLEDKWIAKNVKIIPIYVPHPALYPFIAYKKALDEHKRDSYNLVTTEEPFRTGFAAWLFKKNTGAALSVEYHTDTFYNKVWFKERPFRHALYNMIGKITDRGADSIRCVNQKNLLDLRQVCENNPDKLIENIPVPTEFYSFEKHGIMAREIRRKLLKNSDDVIILFVGRLVTIKKIDELIRLFAQIGKKYQNIHLVIVGDGPDKRRLTRLANELGGERIIFTGYIPENEVLGYYGASDIFVNPAHIEPYGRIYIEAMSAGKPVITTSGAGAVDDRLCIHNVNSIVVEPGNADELKGALLRLVEDSSLRKRLGENALMAVQQKFNYDDSLQRMKEFWERTISAAIGREVYANR